MSLVNEISIIGFRPFVGRARATLERIDPAFLRCCRDQETTIHVLSPQQQFKDINVDYYLRGVADECVNGMYDRKRNQIILRKVDNGTAAHELYHLVDTILGTPGRFRSEDDPAIIKAYKRQTRDNMHISAYSEVAVYELAAEAARALLGFTSSRSLSGRSDADRLRELDPELVASIEATFAELRSRYPDPTPPSVEGTAAPASSSILLGVPA